MRRLREMKDAGLKTTLEYRRMVLEKKDRR